MKSNTQKILDKEREQNQRNMVDGVNYLKQAFNKVEDAAETFKRAPNKDYQTLETALKKYKMTLENVK